jgi:hypothetical protein
MWMQSKHARRFASVMAPARLRCAGSIRARWLASFGALVVAIFALILLWSSLTPPATPGGQGEVGNSSPGASVAEPPNHAYESATTRGDDAERQELSGDDLVEESLGRFFNLTGTVRGASGERIADAQVEARPIVRSRENGESAPKPSKTSTASDGSFAFEKLPFRPVQFFVRANGFATGILVVDRTTLAGAPEQIGPIVIVLEKGSSVAGRVVTPDGAPASGAEVMFELERSVPLYGRIWSDFGALGGQSTTADGAGRFKFNNVPRALPDYLDIFARRDNLSGLVRVGRDTSGTIEISLFPNLSIGGAVVDESGAGIAGARVLFGRSSAMTDANGRYQFSIDRRDYKIPGKCLIAAPGYACAAMNLDPAAAMEGTLSMPVVTLTKGATLEGRVVGERGTPLRGVIVTAEGGELAPGTSKITDPGRLAADARSHRLEIAYARTDESGAFRIEHLPTQVILVSVRVPGMPTPPLFKQIVPPARDVLFELPADPPGFGSIEGHVVDRATRRPIAQFRLMATTPWGDFQAVTTPDGEFRLGRVPSGRIRLRIAPATGASFLPVERLFTLDPGEQRRDVLLDVGGEGSIRFVYSGAQDAPLPSAGAVLLPLEGDGLSDGPIEPSESSPGMLRFERVPPGLYQISIVDGSCALAQPVRARVAPGESVEVRGVVSSGALCIVAVAAYDGSATLAPYGVRIRESRTGTIVVDRRPGVSRMLAHSGARAVLQFGDYRVAIDRGDQTIAEKPMNVTSEGGVVEFTIDSDPPR